MNKAYLDLNPKCAEKPNKHARMVLDFRGEGVGAEKQSSWKPNRSCKIRRSSDVSRANHLVLFKLTPLMRLASRSLSDAELFVEDD